MSYTKQDVLRMMEAVEASGHSIRGELDGGPFGAVIYRGDELIATGWNHVLSAKDPTAHAEVYTIREACRRLNTFDLSGCVLYSSCEPCPMCLMAAKWANLDNVFFAATRQDAAQIGFRDDDLYHLLKDGIYATPIPECRQAAAQVMQEWYSLFGQKGSY